MTLSRLSAFLLLMALIGAGIYPSSPGNTTTPSSDPVYLPENEIHIPATSAEPSVPSLHAKYSCVMDGNTNRILFQQNGNQKVPMASTTKIMTALLVLESGRTNETVKVSSYAASMPKVHLGMCTGYEYKLNDLLYSLMLESHNDTAVAIAEHMSGSVENFAKEMNKKAKELGMNNTHFVTPNGLDAANHYSTASDMCRLASYAVKNSAFCNLVATGSHSFQTIDGTHSYTVSNKDAFLSYYEGALGIKTGFTGKAGYCFVGAAKRNGATLTSCVLASGWPPNKSYKWADTKALMDYGFQNFSITKLPVQNLTAVKIPVEGGKKSVVSCIQPEIPEVLISRSDSITVLYDLSRKLYAPVRKNTPIGTVSFYINDTFFKKEEIFPSENIEKSCFSDTIGNVFQLWDETFCQAG